MGEEQRWQRAVQRAQAAEARRSSRLASSSAPGADGATLAGASRRALRWVAGTVVAVEVAVLLTAASQASTSSGAHDRDWAHLAAGACLLAGIALLVTGCATWFRRHGSGDVGDAAVTAPLTRAQRRAARTQVLGRAPVQAEHLPVLVHLAQRMALDPWLLVGQLGVSLVVGGDVLLTTWTPLVALYGALVVAAGVAVVLVDRSTARAQRFLAAHPAAHAAADAAHAAGGGDHGGVGSQGAAARRTEGTA